MSEVSLEEALWNPLKKSDKDDSYDPVFLFLTFSGQRREGSKYSSVIVPQYFPQSSPQVLC